MAQTNDILAPTRRLIWPDLSIGLSTKMAVFLVIGTVSMIGIFAYLGTAALSENTQRTLQERVVLAQMTASYVDALLENIENVMTYTATEDYWSDPDRINAALERAFQLRLGFFASRIFLVDSSGRILSARPTLTTTTTLQDLTPVNAVLAGSPFAVSHVSQSFGGAGESVLAAAPIKDRDGKIQQALVISLNFANPDLHAFTHPVGLGQSGYMDLIALDGEILASTRPERVGRESDHCPYLCWAADPIWWSATADFLDWSCSWQPVVWIFPGMVCYAPKRASPGTRW